LVQRDVCTFHPVSDAHIFVTEPGRNKPKIVPESSVSRFQKIPNRHIYKEKNDNPILALHLFLPPVLPSVGGKTNEKRKKLTIVEVYR